MERLPAGQALVADSPAACLRHKTTARKVGGTRLDEDNLRLIALATFGGPTSHPDDLLFLWALTFHDASVTGQLGKQAAGVLPAILDYHPDWESWGLPEPDTQ